jgi:hypothetical protein
LAARRSELLATPYAHVVFTLPHQLAPLALQNKKVIYGLLFRWVYPVAVVLRQSTGGDNAVNVRVVASALTIP